MLFANIVDNMRDVGTQTGFTPQQFIAQCIAVIVLFLVLQKFAWGPVTAILEQRRKAIEDSMANADRIKQELAEAEQSRHAILIVSEAKKSAAALTEKLAQEAQAQAQEIIRKGHEAAAADRARLFAELKQEVGALVIQTTEKVAGKVLTADDQSRLNTETVRELSAKN